MFENKEDKDLIFKSGTYLFGWKGIYLNRWSLYFDPRIDVPSFVPIFVWLPNLPLVKTIWDSFGYTGYWKRSIIASTPPSKEDMQHLMQQNDRTLYDLEKIL